MVDYKMNLNWIFFFSSFFFSFFSISQEISNFSGLKKIGEYYGLANFEFYTKGNDTIYNGNFQFGNALEKENEAQKQPIIVSGNFIDNKPTGEWTFKFGKFNLEEKKKLVNYKYVIEINGVQKSIFVNFNEGKPNGKWIIQIDSLENSEITKTLFKSEFEYENGIPQKSFRIENDTEFMVGRLLRDGTAHDIWSLYTKEGIGELENWYFKDGQLQNISFINGEETKKLDLNYGKTTNTVTINLDKHYLDIMEFYLRKQNTSHVFDRGMSSLLKTDDENYELVLHFFESLGISLDFSGFKVNVPEFPFSENEQITLNQIKQAYKSSDTAINNILSDTQLNILKLNDTKSQFLYQVAELLDSVYIQPVSKLIIYEQQDILKHITRENLIKKLWPNGFPDKEIKIVDSVGQERNYMLEKSSHDFSKKNLNGVLELTKFTAQVSEKLQSKLQKILSSTKRKKVFLAKENLLISEVNMLKKRIDSVSLNQPNNIEKTLKSIKSFIDKTLTDYSKMEENTEKLNYNSQLTECFKEVRNLVMAVKNIPSQQKKIKETYQEQIWNPFTATIMDENIKKRITKAYEKNIIPYFLDDIQNNLDCDNELIISKNLEKLYKRMLEMKNEDTKRLERKLKRVEDPIKILDLFGLSNE